jgi:hypothetical protein
MAKISTDHTNVKDMSVTSCKTYKEFVEGHKETLNYLLRFGSPIEQAKAGLLMDLGEGVL